jgi:hypothetical protein
MSWLPVSQSCPQLHKWLQVPKLLGSPPELIAAPHKGRFGGG